MWEECLPGGKLGRWHVPQATMDRRGDIQLNRTAWEWLGSPENVWVLFDRATQTIGLKPAGGPIRNTFPLTETRNGGRRIQANGLHRQFRVPLDKTVRFASPTLDEDGILILDLKTARPAYHGGRIGAFHKERCVPLKHAVDETTQILTISL